MITLETGVPGAGKTLYCVDKLLRSMVGTSITMNDDDGNPQQIPRTIFSNINGLLLEHEKINAEGLLSWHQWAKPGALIVFDEVQKVPGWDLQPNGSKVHESVKALETHRHMGVDFIVLTQHPMLIHQNLVRLVGRHLHVRRMGNMGLAVVYEWDSCSRSLLYKNSITKAPYRYSSKVFELYKSAEAHTKQPRKVPTLVWLGLAAIGGLAIASPTTLSRIGDRINPPPKTAHEAAKPAKTAGAPAKPASAPQAPPAPSAPASAPVVPLAAAAPAKFAGCAAVRDVCKCFTADGETADKPAEFCTGRTKGVSQATYEAPSVEAVLSGGGSVSVDPAADRDLAQWLARRAGRTPY